MSDERETRSREAGRRRRVAAWLPAPAWARSYPRALLRDDVSAGLTVAVLLIPQSMAYATLAGMPPQAGLYAAIVSLVVYAALGTSSFISVAPVAIDSLLVAAAVGPIAQGDTEIYVTAAALLAVMTGLIQITLGTARLGALVNFLSVPVISGFTSAAAITIAASQLKDLLGITVDGATGSDFLATVSATVNRIETLHLPTALIATASIVALVAARRIAPKAPAALLTVAAATAAVAWWGLDRDGVRILGEVPSGLPTPRLPPLDAQLVADLAPAALTIALISYTESISTAKAFAARTRQRVNPNRELLAIGAANVAAGVFRGFPVAGGFSRGAVNFRAGAKTQLSGVIAAAVLAVAVVFLTPLFFHLPKAALAAVIVVAVASLIDIGGARRLARIRVEDGVALAVTFLATLLVGVAAGLLIGIAFSLAVFIFHTAKPHVAELGRVDGTSTYRNVERWNTHTDERIAVLRMDAPLYFANAKFLADRVQQLIAAHPAVHDVVLVAAGIGDIDASGVQQLIDLDEDLEASGIRLHLVNVIGPVRDVLANAGRWHQLVANGRVHPGLDEAIHAICGDSASPLIADATHPEPAPRGIV